MKFLITSIVILTLLVSPVLVVAGVGSDIQLKHKSFFESSGYVPAVQGNQPIARIIGVIVSSLLLLVSIIFLSFTVYSGIQWMTAGGNEESVKKARSRVTRATIGLVIVLGAWIITSFILNAAFGPPAPGGIEFGPFRAEIL